MVLDSSADKHCVLGMHHMKALDALGRLLHRAYGGRSRHHGSIQLVWCALLPVLITQIEFLTEQMVLDSSTNKHCMLGMHHMKALDALGRLLHRAYGGRSRHHGSIQLVWCALLPVLITQIEFLTEQMVLDFSADKHCMLGMHHMKALDALGRLLHRAYGGRSRHHGPIQLVWCAHPPTDQPHGFVVFCFCFKLFDSPVIYLLCNWWLNRFRLDCA